MNIIIVGLEGPWHLSLLEEWISENLAALQSLVREYGFVRLRPEQYSNKPPTNKTRYWFIERRAESTAWHWHVDGESNHATNTLFYPEQVDGTGFADVRAVADATDRWIREAVWEGNVQAVLRELYATRRQAFEACDPRGIGGFFVDVKGLVYEEGIPEPFARQFLRGINHLLRENGGACWPKVMPGDMALMEDDVMHASPLPSEEQLGRMRNFLYGTFTRGE